MYEAAERIAVMCGENGKASQSGLFGLMLLMTILVPAWTGFCGTAEDQRPLTTNEIADAPPPDMDYMGEEALARRQKNLYLMDYIVTECEYRRHIMDYKPLCAHLMFDRWRNEPLVDAREEVPYEIIDAYAEWGVQRIQLHHDTWTHMGRMEPLNEAVFTRFVDYCHRKGIEVGCYVIMGTTSPKDPELPEKVYTLPLYHIRPPDTYGKEERDYRAPWYMTNVFSPAWQHYVLTGLERLFTKYKVDGIYYDSGAIIGACGRDSSSVYGIRYYSRTRNADTNADIFNMVSNVCARYGKWITVYSNSPNSGKNYGFFSQALKYRLVGEAGDVKSLKTFWNINRAGNQAPYHVNVWNDPYTMPPDRPFYACNLVFLQFPYLMSWRKPSLKAPGELLFNDEQVELWRHYAGIYREITKENTVAYVNARNNKFLKNPIEDEYVACTVLVRENVYMILANISDEDREIDFTTALVDMETGERNLRSVVLPKGGSMRIFRIPDIDSFEPAETPVEKAIRNIIEEGVIVDMNNLALEGRVETGTDPIFQYVRATQANDGNLHTFWSPNPNKQDAAWWDTHFTKGAFNELPKDFDSPPVRNRRWYMVELREPGDIEKIQIVTRPEDAADIHVFTTALYWEHFKEIDITHRSIEYANGLAYLSYAFPPVSVRFVKTVFTGRDPNQRIYEVRAYRNASTPILHERGRVPLRRLNAERVDEDITAFENVALKKSVTANYPGQVENLVDGNPATTFTSGTEVFGGGVWCALDLGKAYAVDRIQVIPHCGEKDYYQYIVYGSPDGEDWFIAADASEDTHYAGKCGATFSFSPENMRYIALKTTFNSAGIYDNWQMLETDLAEIKVRGR